MKKIIVLTAFLCMLLTSVCSAFKEPDPNRWLWITSTDKIGCWVDLQTIKFEMQDNEYSDCYKHRFVTAWVQMYIAETDEVETNKWYCDLDFEKYKFLSITKYDGNGKLISSNDVPSCLQNYSSIIPGTVGEVILFCFKELWDVNEYATKLKNANDI